MPSQRQVFAHVDSWQVLTSADPALPHTDFPKKETKHT